MKHPHDSNRSAGVTRRRFISRSLTAGAALALLPGRLARAAKKSPADGRRINVAFVGIGNRGHYLLRSFADSGLVNVVAFCDVDLMGAHTGESRRLFPDVPGFQDFREMFAKLGDRFEAVVVATPDHTHFVVAMYAMARGKHVYVEKPLGHTFQEVEMLMARARETGVVTQMGNQGHSGNNYHQFKAWTEAGVIKDVTKIVMYNNAPLRFRWWPATDSYPAGDPVPSTLDWDLWHAGKEVRPFSPHLHPAQWRNWTEFGGGALGDWGAHILDTAHRFLHLGFPRVIEVVRCDGPSELTFPRATTLRFDFAARPGMPPVEVWWYDGVDNLPPLPPELGAAGKLPNKYGKLIYTKDLVFQGGTHGDSLRIIPESRMQELAPTLPRIKGGFSDHTQNFILACQGREETRSPFHIGGPLVQVLLLGIIAQRLGGRFEFDPVTRRFINNPRANELLADGPPRPEWAEYYRA